MTKYPIGEQDFKSLIEGGFSYVDKTRYIEKIIEGMKYVFLARPRRFGKSLFLSTLKYFFEGTRHLFKGLYIDSVNWEWIKYPVLRIDLNPETYERPGKLDDLLDNLFGNWEAEYNISHKAKNLSQRFNTIIRRAHEVTGRQVVILVDEYDKPLVENINNAVNIDHYRNILTAIYSNFKSSAEHIRLVFITGVSRFSKLSIFSGLNNLKDISMTDQFADICGITETEMTKYFSSGIITISNKEEISFDHACAQLKAYYDGYRFAKSGSEIYNPWSLLNALNDAEICNYWNDTGIPHIVAETLKRTHADLSSFFDSYCEDEDLKGLDLLSPHPLALLYQTGYLTIKEYIPKIKRYRMGIPNKEVKEGLYDVLLPYYVRSSSDKEVPLYRGLGYP